MTIWNRTFTGSALTFTSFVGISLTPRTVGNSTSSAAVPFDCNELGVFYGAESSFDPCTCVIVAEVYVYMLKNNYFFGGRNNFANELLVLTEFSAWDGKCVNKNMCGQVLMM